MVQNTSQKPAHQILSDEKTALYVQGLTDKISIMLEGVEIVRGYDQDGTFVSVVRPVAGESILLYPFAGDRVS